MVRRTWKERLGEERYAKKLARERERNKARRAEKPALPRRACLNCDAQFTPKRRDALFCGERCRQIAEWVRYARRKITEGTFNRPDIRVALQSRLSTLISGFYDKRGDRFVSDEARERLRGIGRCQNCDQAFTPDGDGRFTVQHIRAEAGFRLEAWCYGCNMEHAQSVVRDLTNEESSFIADCLNRAHSPMPMRDCDDEIIWAAKRHELAKPPLV